MLNSRLQFHIFNQKINNQPLIYFDNAATTQKPQTVIDAVSDFYQNYNSNVHRGLNPLTDQATQGYEQARKTVADFIKAQAVSEIIFRDLALLTIFFAIGVEK